MMHITCSNQRLMRDERSIASLARSLIGWIAPLWGIRSTSSTRLGFALSGIDLFIFNQRLIDSFIPASLF
jgi:hypothetical protein